MKLSSAGVERPDLALHDFFKAYAVVRRHVPPTGLAALEAPSGMADMQLMAKQEMLAPGSSFKCRGAVYRISRLTPAQREAGVAACSTGNHAIGVAYAAQRVGTTAAIVVPESAAENKVEMARALGAEVHRQGANLTEAFEVASALADRERRVLVDDGNDSDLMVGAGTVALEALLELPEAEVIVVPVGGGNLIAGMGLCAKAINPSIEVVGVQSSAAPAAHDSWHAGELVHRPNSTFAGGLSTEHPGELALAGMLAAVDDMVLVSDDDLRRAMAEGQRQLDIPIEGAGAAALAAISAHGSRWTGKIVVAVLTGGNAEPPA